MAAAPDDDQSRELVLRASQGEPLPLEQLLERYLPRLRAFVRAEIDAQQRLGESAADLVQSTCRELLQAGPDFTWQGEARFRSWLFTAARNKIRMRLRHQRTLKRQHVRDADADVDRLVDPVAAAHSPSREAIGHEANQTMQRALDSLLPDQREVIALARLAGLPIPEVARLMERSENAVRTLLSRSLVALAAAIDRLEGHSREA